MAAAGQDDVAGVAPVRGAFRPSERRPAGSRGRRGQDFSYVEMQFGGAVLRLILASREDVKDEAFWTRVATSAFASTYTETVLTPQVWTPRLC